MARGAAVQRRTVLAVHAQRLVSGTARRLPDALDPMCPSPDLPYEVRVYDVTDGIVGEDHWGGAPRWWTTACCTDLDKACKLADCGYLRAEVWEHLTTDRSVLPTRFHRADADLGRPKAPQLPFDTWPAGRPHSPAHARTHLVPRREAPAALRTEGVERGERVGIARLVHWRPHPGRYRRGAARPCPTRARRRGSPVPSRRPGACPG